MALMRLFGFFNCDFWLFFSLCTDLNWLDFPFLGFEGVAILNFCNMPRNNGADMIFWFFTTCQRTMAPIWLLVADLAPIWLVPRRQCDWQLACELSNIQSFDNSLPPLCHKSTNVIRTSQCELFNNANFDILYIHVLFRISTSVQHLLGLIRVLKDFN